MPCEFCYGTGQQLEHSDDCTNDLCALNGDYHSCVGQLVPCSCPVGRRRELSPGLRRVYWLIHPKAQVVHPLDDPMPHRFRHRWHWRPGFGPYLYRHRRCSSLYRPIELREARAPDHMALLAELMEVDYGTAS